MWFRIGQRRQMAEMLGRTRYQSSCDGKDIEKERNQQRVSPSQWSTDVDAAVRRQARCSLPSSQASRSAASIESSESSIPPFGKIQRPSWRRDVTRRKRGELNAVSVVIRMHTATRRAINMAEAGSASSRNQHARQRVFFCSRKWTDGERSGDLDLPATTAEGLTAV